MSILLDLRVPDFGLMCVPFLYLGEYLLSGCVFGIVYLRACNVLCSVTMWLVLVFLWTGVCNSVDSTCICVCVGLTVVQVAGTPTTTLGRTYPIGTCLIPFGFRGSVPAR